jgi:hypothetical protein
MVYVYMAIPAAWQGLQERGKKGGHNKLREQAPTPYEKNERVAAATYNIAPLADHVPCRRLPITFFYFLFLCS